MKVIQFNCKAILLLAAIICFIGCKDSTHNHEMAHPPIPNGGSYAENINNGTIKEDTMKGSPERYAMTLLKQTHLHITYHSPGVKGRVIWGGLVPYGKVWVSGAHNATTLEINHSIKIQNKVIEPGKYAFFTIPNKDKWVVIINKTSNQHLTDDYSENDDVARFEVVPEANRMTPRLTYNVKQLSENEGAISLEWEKIKITLPFSEQD